MFMPNKFDLTAVGFRKNALKLKIVYFKSFLERYAWPDNAFHGQYGS